MTYEEFKKTIIENIKAYLPDDYQHLEVYVRAVEKVNTVKDGLTIRDPERKSGFQAFPTFYINDLYDTYKNGRMLYELLCDLGNELAKAYEEGMSMGKSLKDILSDPSRIIYELINTEQNRELLSQIPHREFLDLSIIYRYVVDINDNSIRSGVIRNGLTDYSEQELYAFAKTNTPRLLPAKMRSMEDILFGFGKNFSDINENEIRELISECPPIFVLTNDKLINGAATVLYDGMLDMISDVIGENLMLIPSSVNEFLVLPESFGPAEQISWMVREINLSEVSLEERLSNEVYHYDRQTQKMTLATDVPIKSLEEPQLYIVNPSHGRKH